MIVDRRSGFGLYLGMTLNEAYEITRTELFHFNQVSTDESVKSLRRELKKLAKALKEDETDKEEVGNRLANLIISTLVTAGKFGVKDLESLYRKRIVELQFGISKGV